MPCAIAGIAVADTALAQAGLALLPGERLATDNAHHTRIDWLRRP